MAQLNIPQSNSTVRLRAIDAKTSMSVHSRRFLEPQIAGFDTLNLTSVCFLIDNHNLNQRILFDCGARKDFENYSPTTKARLNAIVKGIKIEADVNDILVDAGIHLDSLDSMIWSHWHVRILMCKRVPRNMWSPRRVSHGVETHFYPYLLLLKMFANPFALYL